MRYYEIKYCLCEDCRTTLTLDLCYHNYNDAISKALEWEEDPEVYTAWVVECYDVSLKEESE